MSKPKFPRYSQTAQTGDRGVRIVEQIVSDQFGWIFREQENQLKDFGIDAHVEVVDDDRNVLGRMLALQIKSGSSYFRKKNSEGYIFSGDNAHLNYYLNYPLPVILVLCNTVSEKCWWCEINPLETEETKKGWKITVPFSQSFDLDKKYLLTKLAGPAQDHLPTMYQYWTVNEIIQKHTDFISIVIDRGDIETGNIDTALKSLNRLRVTKRIALRYKERVSIAIDGYNNDPRELWRIPKVRNWVYELNKRFPYWFYFMSKDDSSLLFITFCICNFDQIFNDKIKLNNISFSNFMGSGFAAMNEICSNCDLTEEEIESMSKNVSSYYKSRMRTV